MDLRCPNGKKLAVLEGAVIELKCNRRDCGARPGVAVLHRFDAGSGEFIETLIFKDPERTPNVCSIE